MTMDFLKRLLTAPGPSGGEQRPARVWREEAATFADEVYSDVLGSTYAKLNGGEARVLLGGHIDEIGLIVTYIDDDGFLFFAGVGGWDSQVLVGQRIRLIGKQGDVIGVIGKKAIHLMKPDERNKVSQIEDLWIDIGVKSRSEAQELVRVGAFGVIDAPVYEMPHGRIVSRSLDNRIGAYTVLEALRLLAVDRPAATVMASANVQEEIGLIGARPAAFQFDPQAAIIVDVTHSSDYPNGDKKLRGACSLGGGPVLARGSVNNSVVVDMLVELAERENIPFSMKVNPEKSSTDADSVYWTRQGVACAVMSIPNRYMHSPNEMVQMDDVQRAARLIAAFVRAVSAETDFIPR